MRLHLIEEISLTDMGMKRGHNEDAIGDVQLLAHLTGKPENLVKRGRLYAVADGMGGYAGGEIASHLALQALFLTYYSLQGHPLDDFKKAVLAANQAVYQAGNNDNPMQSSSGAAALDRQFSPKATQPENHTPGSSQEDVYEADSQHHMGTTLTAALLVENTLYTANVGDSRIYLLRKGKMSQLTRDHSVVGEGVRQGLFTKEQARSSPFSNLITRALGQHSQIEADFTEIALQKQDVILLCSDGLYRVVDEQLIEQTLGKMAPGEAGQYLIQTANRLGSPDNISVVIVKVGKA